MGNVVKFEPKTKVEVKKEDNSNKLLLGQIDYTCPECHHTNHITLQGLIFKYVEGFCSNCGTSLKISNPGFSRVKK